MASYNEGSNIATLLAPILESVDSESVIVVADDSSEPYRAIMEAQAARYFQADLGRRLFFSFADQKSGRGVAIRRGFTFLRENFPNLEFMLEMDGDGSHRPVDVIDIAHAASEADLLIGSRYLPQSEIVGWSAGRRTLSKYLNFLIPKFLGVNISDATNGLRRYSSRAVDLILAHEPQNSGFIYLSECALVVKKHGLQVDEVPIIFEDRISGTSSVGFRELSSALVGILKIFILRIR